MKEAVLTHVTTGINPEEFVLIIGITWSQKDNYHMPCVRGAWIVKLIARESKVGVARVGREDRVAV